MKMPGIPSVQPVGDRMIASILRPMKENIEILNGVRSGMIEKLPENADLSSVVAKINEIIGRLNANE